jgi:quinol monooxygenase YgiN
MIFEIAEIDVKPGSEKDFEKAVEQAAPQFRMAKGCRSMALHRIIERPATYRLVVGWDNVEDHMVLFRNSENFQEWRRLAGPYFANPLRVDHVSVVLQAFSNIA